ncbi:MAG: helix-turn-helix domain-containing protein [Mesorhizobium sp.]|nr:helix-turn-helix domain-containing protein [Mesorhizobium sp. M1D.F.Ca.ET.043.01.1.1]RWA95870.1 MAG: helix-turn-helix domain-containing protein [Mesorhizobium sp.]RWE04913.1 MAG: helix-turn-helix domain-containing protein [Mesorhizobium sp.]TJW86448.1 MAG: helix-turn-helix domain-containing protein [Mesorhizobium sp.]
MRARWSLMCRSACRTCRSAIWMSSFSAMALNGRAVKGFRRGKRHLKRGPDGENPIRAARILRGLSGSQLAMQAGITPSMLSQIERSGKAAPAPEAQRFWRNASD